MKLIPNFDPQLNQFILELQVGFLDKYYGNLQGMLEMKSSELPPNLKIVKVGKNMAKISFPLPNSSSIDKVDDGIMKISIDDTDGNVRTLHSLINSFINSGIREEFKSTEFIPLNGYPKEDIIKDCKESMKNKRNLCIIKDYSEYLQSQEKSNNIKYTQYYVNYGTNEWADICLEILSPEFDLSSFASRYIPKLVVTEWM